MEFELIFKIAGLGIAVAIVNAMLAKAGRDEYVMITTLSGIIIVSVVLLEEISKLFTALESLFYL